jgi:hypothetical protein
VAEYDGERIDANHLPEETASEARAGLSTVAANRHDVQVLFLSDSGLFSCFVHTTSRQARFVRKVVHEWEIGALVLISAIQTIVRAAVQTLDSDRSHSRVRRDMHFWRGCHQRCPTDVPWGALRGDVG